MQRVLLQPHRLHYAAKIHSGALHSSSRRTTALYRGIVPPQHSVLGARGIVIQRRFLLGPFFKIARSGFALAAGAAAGGAAYTHTKFSQATSSISDKFDHASEWAQGVWDKFEMPNFEDKADMVGDPEGNTVSYDAGADHGVSSGGSSGGGNNNGNSGNSGGNGNGGEEALAAAMASLGSPDGDSSVNMDDQVYEMDNQMINLTKKMIEIRNILLNIDGEDKVQLPSIVVIGSQSSGKSSVLEAIVGHEFLPKGSNMVTRRPIELTLVHTAGSTSEYCEFPALRLGQITNFREVQRTLSDLNRAVSDTEVVSDDPIQLQIYSPNVPDLTLIDLPGYIQVVAADQPLELKSRIAALCEKYIQPPNVILAVSAADVDLANSTALRASRRVDPMGQRTIGVISKMDLVDAERGVSTLQSREYPLRMGYVGVITKLPSQSMTHSIFGSNQNMTKAVAEVEQEHFKNPEYNGVTWGVLQLRKKLMKVLEKSMSDSLEPTKRSIRRELEETSYRFKVQYNDRVLTPNTYLAQCADSFKASFHSLSQQFGKDQVRELIKQSLDQKVLDLLAETYWNAPPEVQSRDQFYALDDDPLDTRVGNHSMTSLLTDLSSSKPDMLLWQSKIDELSAAITKLGIGRMSTSILVEAIEKRMKTLESTSSFKNHPLALEEIDKATESVLGPKFYSTADQIENSIKPYKYEVDMDAREWKQSREYAYSLLQEELRQCNSAFNVIRDEVGSSKLNKLVKSLKSMSPSENLDHFSSSLLQKARVAAFLQERAELLKARSLFIKSSKCKTSKNKALCPEIFMDVVANKLAATAVLFLNFELLSDFYYSFPREFDAKLGALSEYQVETLATQDPLVKKHVDLQQRKELLQLALSKLQTISELRNNME